MAAAPRGECVCVSLSIVTLQFQPQRVVCVVDRDDEQQPIKDEFLRRRTCCCKEPPAHFLEELCGHTLAASFTDLDNATLATLASKTYSLSWKTAASKAD